MRHELLKSIVYLKNPFINILRRNITYIYIRYMMFSEDEQDIIIQEFLYKIRFNQTVEYLKDKCSKCQECKFTKQNIELYKLDLPNEVVQNICTMNYDSCYRCHHSTKFIKNDRPF